MLTDKNALQHPRERSKLALSQPAGIGQEIIDSPELAKRWCLPESWIREQVRRRSHDPIPHLRFGKYVRFAWGSSDLENWLRRRMINANNNQGRRDRKEIVQ
jgi:hypothetical protein